MISADQQVDDSLQGGPLSDSSIGQLEGSPLKKPGPWGNAEGQVSLGISNEQSPLSKEISLLKKPRTPLLILKECFHPDPHQEEEEKWPSPRLTSGAKPESVIKKKRLAPMPPFNP